MLKNFPIFPAPKPKLRTLIIFKIEFYGVKMQMKKKGRNGKKQFSGRAYFTSDFKNIDDPYNNKSL